MSTLIHPPPAGPALAEATCSGRIDWIGAVGIAAAVEGLEEQTPVGRPDHSGAALEHALLLRGDTEPAQLLPALELTGENRPVLRLEIGH